MIDVLVVDDDGFTRMMYRHLLQRQSAGCEAETLTSHGVGTLQEAMDWLDDNPAPSCVLLDLGLPDSSGTDGITRLLARWPDLAIVVITGRTDPSLPVQVRQAGARDFVVKDGKLSAERLRTVVREAAMHADTVISLPEPSTTD